jgi:hypothetical protein
LNPHIIEGSNFTPITATSESLHFTYLRDTSGDGLTNVEKINGWSVTCTSVSGTTVSDVESANPQDFATNGLVSDYFEKEFGLNPNTIDTAQSHMLDTWNLTFQLLSATCPTPTIECTYENGWNPFKFAPTPTSKVGDGIPNGTNSTGSRNVGNGGLQDDSAYDSSILWSTTALLVLALFGVGITASGVANAQSQILKTYAIGSVVLETIGAAAALGDCIESGAIHT